MLDLGSDIVINGVGFMQVGGSWVEVQRGCGQTAEHGSRGKQTLR